MIDKKYSDKSEIESFDKKKKKDLPCYANGLIEPFGQSF